MQPTVGISHCNNNKSEIIFYGETVGEEKYVELGQLFKICLFFVDAVCVCVCAWMSQLWIFCSSPVLSFYYWVFVSTLPSSAHGHALKQYAKVNYVFQLRIRRRLFVLHFFFLQFFSAGGFSSWIHHRTMFTWRKYFFQFWINICIAFVIKATTLPPPPPLPHKLMLTARLKS